MLQDIYMAKMQDIIKHTPFEKIWYCIINTGHCLYALKLIFSVYFYGDT